MYSVLLENQQIEAAVHILWLTQEWEDFLEVDRLGIDEGAVTYGNVWCNTNHVLNVLSKFFLCGVIPRASGAQEVDDYNQSVGSRLASTLDAPPDQLEIRKKAHKRYLKEVSERELDALAIQYAILQRMGIEHCLPDGVDIMQITTTDAQYFLESYLDIELKTNSVPNKLREEILKRQKKVEKLAKLVYAYFMQGPPISRRR